MREFPYARTGSRTPVKAKTPRKRQIAAARGGETSPKWLASRQANHVLKGSLWGAGQWFGKPATFVERVFPARGSAVPTLQNMVACPHCQANHVLKAWLRSSSLRSFRCGSVAHRNTLDLCPVARSCVRGSCSDTHPDVSFMRARRRVAARRCLRGLQPLSDGASTTTIRDELRARSACD